MNNDKLAGIIGITCGIITLFAFSFLYITIEIHPFLRTPFVMLAFGMYIVVSLVVWQISYRYLSGEVLGKGVLGEIVIISGAAIMGALIIKSLFKKDTIIYRCPECNLVVMKDASLCRRCGKTFLEEKKRNINVPLMRWYRK